MNYTMSIIKNVQTGDEVELTASGNMVYIVLANRENKKNFISKHFTRDDGSELFWKVGRFVSENMYGWNRWVEMLEA